MTPAPPAAPAEAEALKIGPVALTNPFFLAPLAGLSNWPFRRLAKEAGAGLTVTEMVSATALAHRGRATLELLKTDPDLEKPFCVQLFGKDPDHLAEAARVAVAQGADIIDFNLGCPARKVVLSGHGAALLKEPQVVVGLVRALVRAVKAPVTVKTRPAFSPGAGTTVFDLLPRLVDEGLAALTLHPRPASAGFAGRADWSLVARLAEKSPIPIIGSGDITEPAEAVARLRDSGAAAVMIGRGAKGRPWLFRQCLEAWRGEPTRPATPAEKLLTAERHARLLAELIGPRRAPFLLRTVLMWYTKGWRGAAEFRVRLCREEDLETQLGLLAECAQSQRETAGEGPDMEINT
ncbi:MAG: tRNA-dihydrouridine synthase [Candidatus Adiutrix sp.]|jgi:nifR3 family TIM-barrel protein|nr:tRNA-dihydrouridine synthase [Candidatus Adiutrix sp.]